MFQLNLINKIFETEIMHVKKNTGTRTINRKLSGSGTTCITGTIIEGIKVPELELEL